MYKYIEVEITILLNKRKNILGDERMWDIKVDQRETNCVHDQLEPPTLPHNVRYETLTCLHHQYIDPSTANWYHHHFHHHQHRHHLHHHHLPLGPIYCPITNRSTKLPPRRFKNSNRSVIETSWSSKNLYKKRNMRPRLVLTNVLLYGKVSLKPCLYLFVELF